jgi:UDPglucose--hexose-1-phosphate uridylyltransferase
MTGVGAHEVIIESPDHQLSLGDLTEKQVEDIFWAFRDRIVDLKRDRRLQYVILFKNHGEAAGASLEHTHSQLIALPVVPKRLQEEMAGAKRYYDFRERCVFCDIVRQDLETATHSNGADNRIVLETDHMIAVAPYAPRFPFETWIISKRHHSHFEECDIPAIQSLGSVTRTLIRKLDKVLEKPAFNLMVHTAPIQEGATPYYHCHIEIIPKLTRVAGFEWGTGFYINPTPPEEAAKYLREARV